jgi:hypothetical protein
MLTDAVKSPYAVYDLQVTLRCIPRRCDVLQARLTPHDLRALPLDLFTTSAKTYNLLIFTRLS